MSPDKNAPDLEARVLQLESFISQLGPRIPRPVDPSPDDWGWHWRPRRPIPQPDPGDPVPFDLSRFSKTQLELTRESIKAEILRMQGVLKVVETQLASQR